MAVPSSAELTARAAGVLARRGLDARADWRLLEYWAQVELFHALGCGAVTGLRPYGTYEQPYYTAHPRKGAKSHYKWADLVLAAGSTDRPTDLLWVEMKDLGRNPATWHQNAAGLGADLAAVQALSVRATAQAWAQPQSAFLDKGRLAEWAALAGGLDAARHSAGQLVLAPRALLEAYGAERLIDRWMAAFSAITGEAHLAPERADTERFALLAVVTPIAGT